MSQLQVNQINDASGGVLAPISSIMRNRLINGAMVISQRYGTAATANTINDYTLDRWQVGQTVTGKLIAQQNAGSVTPPNGFSNYLGVTSQSAYSIVSGDIYRIWQIIEGFNTADLGWGTANAKTVTLSFWVRSSLTGTFGGNIGNQLGTRSYPFTYTISAANTWEQKSITIVGDTTGSYPTNNSGSIALQFGLGVGSTYSGTAGAWQAAGLVSATGAVSVVGTSGATFYLTGCQLEVGTQATSFEYRQYQQELALCQRYYYRVNATAAGSGLFGVGWCNSTTISTISIPYPVSMRTNPTALEQSGTAANYQLVFASSAAALSAVPSFGGETTTQGTRIDCTVASGLTTGHGVGLRAGSSAAYLAWSAEL
jgi:hypothetical protein